MRCVLFDAIANFIRQFGQVYFEEDQEIWGTDKEWAEWHASGRKAGDGYLPGPPPPPRPIILPSTRNHGKRSSDGPLVLISAEAPSPGPASPAPIIPSFAKKGLLGTLFGSQAPSAPRGPTASKADLAWLHGRRG